MDWPGPICELESGGSKLFASGVGDHGCAAIVPRHISRTISKDDRNGSAHRPGQRSRAVLLV